MMTRIRQRQLALLGHVMRRHAWSGKFGGDWEYRRKESEGAPETEVSV